MDMDRQRGGRWTPRPTGMVGPSATTAAAAAAVVATVVATVATTATASAAFAAAAVASLPRAATVRQSIDLPVPAVRAMALESIDGVTFHLTWRHSNISTCPDSFSFGDGTSVPGVPPADARLFSGDSIREGDNKCVRRGPDGGLLAVTVDALRSNETMDRLGERGVLERLENSTWSTKNVRWASVVGMRMHTWTCDNRPGWYDWVVAYFGDAWFRIVDDQEAPLTTLPAGHRHMFVASERSLYCLYSAERGGDGPGGNRGADGGEAASGGRRGEAGSSGGGGETEPGGSGGGLSAGAIIGVCVAVAVTIAAATATTLVVWKKRRNGATGGQGAAHKVPDKVPPSPPSPPFPAALGAGAAGYPGGSATWAPQAAPPAIVHFTPPEAAAAAAAWGGQAAVGAAAGGWTNPPSSLVPPPSLIPTGGHWASGVAGGGAAAGGSGGGSGSGGGTGDGRYMDETMPPPPPMPDALLTQP